MKPRKSYTISKKVYYIKNKKKILEQGKKYYEKHKESILENQKEYYKKNRDRLCKYRRRRFSRLIKDGSFRKLENLRSAKFNRKYYEEAPPTQKHWSRWEEDEIEFMKIYLGKITIKEIAKSIGRSFYATRAKIYKLDLIIKAH